MSARVQQCNRLSDLGEFGLIDLISRRSAKASRAIKGIGDDAAVTPMTAKKHLLFTTDMLLEGVHFTATTPAQAIGRKALACSLSDIAAMGGWPTYAVVSLGVPASCSSRFVAQLYRGMREAAGPFKVEIVGGDTVRSKTVVINVALIGEVEKDKVVYRSGARCGDRIFVTGPLGRSLKTGKHLRFTPRIAEGRYLAGRFKPTAMIDVSDGLAADLGHILSESGVGAVIDEQTVPRTKGATLNDALRDGEDFELLFTLSAKHAERLKRKSWYRFYQIGEIVDKKHGLRLRTASGRLKALQAQGYTHF